ncbi:hypothetical protein AGMMS50249_4800 [candidate division SR1 bacterium]|nr:hypothetical protein AGMMS50249_4800 [candidate division SR1 bacterium]
MPKLELLADETLSKKLITKGFWSYFFAFLVAPIGYILRMLISGSVSVSDIGIFYSILGLMGMISAYNDLGLTEAMQYFIPKFWIKGEKAKAKLVIYASFAMQLLTGILIFILLYSGADWLAVHHFHDPVAAQIIKTLAFYFFGLNILTLCTTMFVSFQDTFSQGISNAIVQFCNLIFTIIFRATASLTIQNYAIVRITGVGIGCIASLIIVWRKYKHVILPNFLYKLFPALDTKHPNHPEFGFDKISVLKEHFRYALRVFLVANVSTLLGNVDQQVIVNVLGAESAGFFSNFQSLLVVFTIVVAPLFNFLFPVTTELITKKETEKFGLLQRIMYSYFGGFAVMIAGFFVVFGQEIAVFLFGESFRFSGYMLQRAAPCLIFNCWALISLNILAGLGKIKARLGVVSAALIINVILNFILLVLLHQGLIVSTGILSVSRAVMALGAMRVIAKDYPFSFDLRFLLKNLLLVGILCILMYLLKTQNFGIFSSFSHTGSPRGELFLGLFCYFIIYGLILAFLNRTKIRLLLDEIKKIKGK